MGMNWEILAHKILFKGFFQIDEYKLCYDRFEDGRNEVVREVFERGNSVGVLPYDPERDEIVMIEQFRAGALRRDGSPWLLELIAGMCDKQESPEQVACREAQEEAGCELQNMTLVYDYLASPGGTTEQVKLYVARTNTEGLGGFSGLPAENEDIKVHIVKRAEAIEMLSAGQIDNALTIIGLQWLALNYRNLQARWC